MPIRLPSAVRSMSRLAVAAALTVPLVVLAAGPALADTSWTVRTGGASLNLRSGPGTSYPIVGSLPNGAAVHVYCTKWGQSINGNASWDYLGGGRYATDSLIETGTNGMGAPLCSDTHHSTMEIDPTGTCGGSLGGGVAGVSLVPPADWYEYVPPNVGCYPHDPRYYWTEGNGQVPFGDYFQWLYYAGAYATCDIQAYIPPNDLLSQGVYFNEMAGYSIWTGRGLGQALISKDVNQNTDPNSYGLIDLGSYQADGSGVLAVQLDDYSLYKYGPGHLIRVVAAAMLFDCTQYTA